MGTHLFKFSNRNNRNFTHAFNLVLRTFSVIFAFLCCKEKGEKFVLIQTLRQPRGKDVAANGMFGYAIGSIGDLNQDRLKGELKSFVLQHSLLTVPEAVTRGVCKKRCS